VEKLSPEQAVPDEVWRRLEFTMPALPIVEVGLPGRRELWNVGQTGPTVTS
jgi:hypothetical protein